MSNVFFIHVGIIVALISSSLMIATLIYIDEVIIIGKVSLENPNQTNSNLSNNSVFKHPFKKSVFINYTEVSNLSMCIQTYGPEMTVKFNTSDSIGVFILVGIISIGVITLYLY